MKRDLLTTLRMLRAEGLDAGARLDDGMLEVSIGSHVAVFRSPDLGAASDWLAACTVVHYPASDFARLWAFLARAHAALNVP